VAKYGLYLIVRTHAADQEGSVLMPQFMQPEIYIPLDIPKPVRHIEVDPGSRTGVRKV